MVKLTRAQRVAVKKVFDRGPIYLSPSQTPMTYREFRARVSPTFGCDGAVTLPWCGMWLLIETDGYTHS